MKVYISGSISNGGTLPLDTITANISLFHRAEETLRQFGHEPCIPSGIVLFEQGDHRPWAECLKMDIRALLDCDGIYMLYGWEQSKGARLENHVAIELGMEVLCEPL
jgi:hypothetical protein